MCSLEDNWIGAAGSKKIAEALRFNKGLLSLWYVADR